MTTKSERRGEPQVRAFSEAMLLKLEARRLYGDWTLQSIHQLIGSMKREFYELEAALWQLEYGRGGVTKEDVLYEAADIANYALFIADKVGALEGAATFVDHKPGDNLPGGAVQQGPGNYQDSFDPEEPDLYDVSCP